MPSDREAIPRIDQRKLVTKLVLLTGLTLASAVALDEVGWLQDYPVTANVLAAAASIPLVLLLTITFVERQQVRRAELEASRVAYFRARLLRARHRGLLEAVLDTYLPERSGQELTGVERVDELARQAAALEERPDDAFTKDVDPAMCVEIEARVQDFCRVLEEYSQEVQVVTKDPRHAFSYDPTVLHLRSLIGQCGRQWDAAGRLGDTVTLDAKRYATTADLLVRILALAVQSTNLATERSNAATWDGGYAYRLDDPAADEEQNWIRLEQLGEHRIRSTRGDGVN